ncbi:MAG: GIY-YIG nuclease family protein [Chloroflexi bacterium]|nr:GIY-YIG nuclease family protein [Chloroflexota bacterium]
MTMGDVRGPGSYVLVIELGADREIAVGRLGVLSFPAGHYLYVGSALGGLAGRVRRHLRPEKRQRWHIDYLLAYAAIREVWYVLGPERVECSWAQALAAMPNTKPYGRSFGASDCRCRTHLFCAPEQPDLEALAPCLPLGEAMRRAIPAGF